MLEIPTANLAFQYIRRQVLDDNLRTQAGSNIRRQAPTYVVRPTAPCKLTDRVAALSDTSPSRFLQLWPC